MRNLLEYPLTANEVTALLERDLQRYRDSKAIGGLDGLIYHSLLGALKDRSVMEKVLHQANVA